MVKFKVNEVIAEKGITATDLMRNANIAYGTALKFRDGEEQVGITFEILNNLCKYLECDISDLLEYVPD